MLIDTGDVSSVLDAKVAKEAGDCCFAGERIQMGRMFRGMSEALLAGAKLGDAGLGDVKDAGGGFRRGWA